MLNSEDFKMHCTGGLGVIWKEYVYMNPPVRMS